MLRYALYDYVPRRRIHREAFDQQDVNRRILDFKDGRTYAKRWAAESMAKALAALDLSDTVIVCAPASGPRTHARRFRKFSSMLCQLCQAVNGFDYVRVCQTRKKAHVSGEYELCRRFDELVHIDSTFFQGRNVLVIDDICTTGTTANAFIHALQMAGADVRMALFLAKTRAKRPIHIPHHGIGM